MHALLFLESIGTTELLVIMVAALVLFGPRRLPELGRSLGKSLNEFKRASDDFKQTWEREVAVEKVERERQVERAMVATAPADSEAPTSEYAVAENAPPLATRPPATPLEARPAAEQTIARGMTATTTPATADAASATTTIAADDTTPEFGCVPTTANATGNTSAADTARTPHEPA